MRGLNSMLLKNLFKHWTYQFFAPGTVLKAKYKAFKSLLSHDKRAHELLAELEEIYYGQHKVDFIVIENKYREFFDCVLGIVQDLDGVCPNRYRDLKKYAKKFDSFIRFVLAAQPCDTSPPFAIPLSDIPPDGGQLVGGKAWNLGVIERQLHLPVPPGFVITTHAFHRFIEHNRLRPAIDAALAGLDVQSSTSLNAVSRRLTALVAAAEIPTDVEEAIRSAYSWLAEAEGQNVRISMRSSAVSEDSRSSFAGQYRTVLNVEKDGILDAYKAVIASKYAPTALYYRVNHGLLDADTPMAVLALKMIDAKSSGVMYTRDLETPESENLSIHSIWGLGELLVAGKTAADVISICRQPQPKVVSRRSGAKPRQMIFSASRKTEVVPVQPHSALAPALDDAGALILARWGIKLESHFGQPQDVEWCRDSRDRLFLLQSRPLQTGDIHLAEPPVCNFEDVQNPVLLSGGERAAAGIGGGRVFKIQREEDLEALEAGAVLVARNASPRYVRVMDRLNAVVTDTGSTAGHFASVAREFGVPTIVNTATAFEFLSHGQEVTVHADEKKVYRGLVPSMLESPCARVNLMTDSPFMRKMTYLMSFVSPLELLDPQAASFKPEGCRSFHDIIRFCHEKAVGEMFHISTGRMRKTGAAKKLKSPIPMLFYVIDLGGGLNENAQDQKEVAHDDITCAPLKALLQGLGHPGIRWGEFTHFDWAAHDKIVMSGGIISPKAAMFASHAVVSHDYVNLNLRFGYHFVIVDSLCTEAAGDNYVLFRFSGGGADLDQRILRADFLGRVLDAMSFAVSKKSDLVDGQLKGTDKETTLAKLDLLGRLLGATRLMDMYLKDASQLDGFVSDFVNGRYHFASVEE